MNIFKQSVDVPVSPEVAFAWHARSGAFARLQAPWEPVEVLEAPQGLAVGSGVRLRMRLLGPLRMEAEFRHTEYEAKRLFVDEQVKGPFRSWRHEHRFVPLDDGKRCRLEDVIHYRVPLGGGAIVRRKLMQLFAYRQRIFREDMEHWAKVGPPQPKTVLVTGGTGLIGAALVARLQTLGHTVRILSRRANERLGIFKWDPADGSWDPAAFEGLDALIHLAGAPIAVRWTERNRARILSSRVVSTELLVRALNEVKAKGVRILQASGVNYYGFDLTDTVDESSPSGDGFLAEVCRRWEGAGNGFADAGHSLAWLRTGVVLSPKGGALAKLLPLFKAGLGGPIGRGRRRMPWVGLEDLVEIYVFLLEHAELTGAFNAVGPESADNAAFTRALGKVLRRPVLTPVPPAVLTCALGEMARETILCNLHAVPDRLLKAGFEFRHSDVAKALFAVLNPAYSGNL